jgi:hypothetical protein
VYCHSFQCYVRPFHCARYTDITSYQKYEEQQSWYVFPSFLNAVATGQDV